MNNMNNIYNFWFDTFKNPIKWLSCCKEYDMIISKKYKDTLDKLYDINISDNHSNIKECLETIIMIDQFPRHIYRDTDKAYYFEESARTIVYNNLENVDKYNFYENVFFLMPLNHSENVEDKINLVTIYNSLIEKYPEHIVRIHRFIKMIKYRKEVLEKYGRFPRRHFRMNIKLNEDETNYINCGGLF